jgi:hypothetical protein
MRGSADAREIADPDILSVMTDTLRDFAPHILALLSGGLIGSLGVTYLARRSRAQAKLARMSGWVFGLVCTGVVAGGGGGAVLLVRAAIATQGLRLNSIGPAQLLLFGFLVGIPLSLPGVVFAWSDARARERRRLKRKDFVPTKDDRRRFASDLARQIEEVSPKRRSVMVSIGGEGGRVLVIEGDIDAQEGERLTAALRTELTEHGFKRVEGKQESDEWWSRV